MPSMRHCLALVNAVFEVREKLLNLRVTHGRGVVIYNQVLLGDIGDVFFFIVLGKEVVKGLLLMRANLGRDRQPPFFGVAEDGVNVVNHPAKGEDAVLDNLSNHKFCLPLHSGILLWIDEYVQ